MKKLDDMNLVQKAKSGDKLAFSELVGRHQKGLFQFLAKFMRNEDLAEDIVQEAFVKAYLKLHLFEERSQFKSWLYRIAINLAKNKLKKKDSKNLNIDQVHFGETSKAESALIFEVIQKRVQEEVEDLPERQRVALQLRIFEDLSFQDISEIMNCPYDTAKANYRHALMKLKDVFSKEEGMQAWLQAIDQDLDIMELKIETESL